MGLPKQPAFLLCLVPYQIGGVLPLAACATSDTRNSTKKTKNSIFAIPAALAAIPPKPSTAAIRAMIRKVKAQLSISLSIMVALV
jgi:hypothetical protein